jgi:hypothetical protein
MQLPYFKTQLPLSAEDPAMILDATLALTVQGGLLLTSASNSIPGPVFSIEDPCEVVSLESQPHQQSGVDTLQTVTAFAASRPQSGITPEAKTTTVVAGIASSGGTPATVLLVYQGDARDPLREQQKHSFTIPGVSAAPTAVSILSTSATGATVGVGIANAGSGLTGAVFLIDTGLAFVRQASPSNAGMGARFGATLVRLPEPVSPPLNAAMLACAPGAHAGRGGCTLLRFDDFVGDAPRPPALFAWPLLQSQPGMNLGEAALHDGGGVVVVSAPGYMTSKARPQAGAVVILTWGFFSSADTSPTLTPHMVLTSPCPSSHARFGAVIAMSCNILAVSAPGHDSHRGAVFIYRAPVLTVDGEVQPAQFLTKLTLGIAPDGLATSGFSQGLKLAWLQEGRVLSVLQHAGYGASVHQRSLAFYRLQYRDHHSSTPSSYAMSLFTRVEVTARRASPQWRLGAVLMRP